MASLDEPAQAPLPGKRRLALCLAALALMPSLSGCVAVALAIPVAAAVGMIGANVRVRAATPVPERRGQAPGTDSAALASTGARSAPGVTLTTLGALPPPSWVGGINDPWTPFITYTLQRAGNKQKAESVLLAPGAATTMSERRLACPESQPAVIVDLDSGTSAFAPGSAGQPSPGLTEGLKRLREAGIVVLWLSRASANEVREVADALLLSGLDPSGRDPLLLVRHDGDRKQTLRLEANLDVCVIAIAGDQRGDFDELFDYLRDPEHTLGFEGMIGSGWFIAPLPFGPAAQ